VREWEFKRLAFFLTRKSEPGLRASAEVQTKLAAAPVPKADLSPLRQSSLFF
jgi:hypothetical protein